jgi:hypothetical protein
MIWLLLIVVLIAIFGIGTLLEAAFWTLLIAAAAVVVLAVLASRLIGGARSA